MKTEPITKRFTWREFKKYRNQTGLQKMSEHMVIGNELISTAGHMNSIEIDKTASLNYSWNIYNGTLYERLNFKDGMNLSFTTMLTGNVAKKKKAFLDRWVALLGLEFYGSIKAPREGESLLTLDNLANDIAHYLRKVVEAEGERRESDISVGSLRYKHAANSFVHYDHELLLDLFVLEGGDYFIVYDKKNKHAALAREMAEFVSEAIGKYRLKLNVR